MKPFLLLIFVFISVISKASNYYLSTQAGDDSRNTSEAQNQTTPWKTIDKLNTISLKPGDSVFFKMGDVFYGSLLVRNSGIQGMPIYYGAYGTGANPIISGFTTISQWTLYSGNIYYAPLDVPALNMVTFNNNVQGMGRYPNKGYLSYESHTGNISITDSQLILNNNWVGAEAVIRKYRWVIDRHTITSQVGNTLFYNALSTYGSNKSYNPVDNNGYFIQNNLATLDTTGEWYYDVSAKYMYMDFTGSTPDNNSIKVSTKDKNIVLDHISNIYLNGLDFEGGNIMGMYLFNCQNVTVNNCKFLDEGGVSIYGAPTNNIIVQNSSVTNSLSNGIYFEFNGNDCTIDNVTVQNTNIIAGSGRSGDAVGNGIMIRGNNTIIRKCKVINSGFNGIQFAGNNILVEKNFIDSFCMIKDDGGGIYTYTGKSAIVNSNQKIQDNIILDGKGASEGTNDIFNKPVHGIYLDNNSNNVEVNNNTIARNGESGIFVHDSYNLKITNNTLIDNPTGLQMTEDILDSASFIKNNIIKNNIIFSKNDSQMVAALKSKTNDFEKFSYFDSNFYARPFSDKAIITTSYTNAGFTSFTGHDLSSWQSFYYTDINSYASPVKIPAYTINSLVGSNIYTNENFTTKTIGFSASSRTNNCKINWVPESGLDSGALKISFTDPVVSNRTALVSLNIGVLSAPKTYILKFSLLGSKKNSSIRVYLKNNNAPYNDLSTRKYCKLTTVRTENELLLTLPGNNMYSSIVFEVNEADSILWIDNVKFYEANITLTDTDKFIRFEYNATENPVSIWLNENYVDVTNRNYIGNVIIPPYSSKILIKNIPVGAPRTLIFTGEKDDKNVNLAWDKFNDISTRKFEIEKSNDTMNFKLLGNLSFNLKNPAHAFTDYNPFPGKNYYRIKQFDEEGKYVYSKILMILFDQLIGLNIFPNPTKGDLNIIMSVLPGQTQRSLCVRNMQGVILKTFALNSLDKTFVLNTSFLKSGIYLLTHEGENLLQHSQFIKL